MFRLFGFGFNMIHDTVSVKVSIMNFMVALNGNFNGMGRDNLKFTLSFTKSSILQKPGIGHYKRFVPNKFLHFHIHSYTAELFLYQSSKDKRSNKFQYG